MTKSEYLDKISSDIGILNNGRYFFDNPWDMECCVVPYPYKRQGYSPNGDPEWVYQYARMEWLYKYVYLYNETNDTNLLKNWEDKILHFYKTNSCTKSVIKSYKNKWLNSFYVRLNKRLIYGQWVDKASTYRTLDTAIRNYYVLLSLEKASELREAVEATFIMNKVKEDMEFTISHLREFDQTSNWGIIIVSAYCICKLMLSDKDIDKPMAILRKMLENQIYPSGCHIECSTMYHNEVLLYLTRLIHQMQRSGYEVPVFLNETATRMFRQTIALSGMDNHQVAYGDSDNTDLSSLYIVCSQVYHVDIPTPNLDNLDFMLLSEFDIDGTSKIKGIKNYVGDGCKARLEVLDNGIAIFSSCKTKLIVFNEKGVSGHKHQDNGSFVLFKNAEPLLIDSGRYTYNDMKWRSYFKSSQVHNMAIVENSAISSQATLELEGSKFENYAVIIYRCRNEQNGLKMLRCYVILEDEALLIADIISMKGEHRLETFYTPANNYQFAYNGSEEVCFEAKSGSERYIFHNPCGLKSSIVKGFVSPSYNSMQEIARLCMSKDFKDYVFTYVLIDSFSDKMIDVQCEFVNNRLFITKHGQTISIETHI